MEDGAGMARVERLAGCARAALRYALGAAFLSAVASRLGVWGAHAGHPSEAFAAFQESVRELNPWSPEPLIPSLATTVTALEATCGVALVAGVRGRVVPIAAGVLLGVFALAMTVFTGAKSALDYSVWTAAAGAFVLATTREAGPVFGQRRS